MQNDNYRQYLRMGIYVMRQSQGFESDDIEATRNRRRRKGPAGLSTLRIRPEQRQLPKLAQSKAPQRNMDFTSTPLTVSRPPHCFLYHCVRQGFTCDGSAGSDEDDEACVQHAWLLPCRLLDNDTYRNFIDKKSHTRTACWLLLRRQTLPADK